MCTVPVSVECTSQDRPRWQKRNAHFHNSVRRHADEQRVIDGPDVGTDHEFETVVQEGDSRAGGQVKGAKAMRDALTRHLLAPTETGLVGLLSIGLHSRTLALQ